MSEMSEMSKMSEMRCDKGDLFTITFGDVCENHVGMQQIGRLENSGFNLEDLKVAQKWFQEKGIDTELLHLDKYLEECDDDHEAYILIARNGLSAITDVNAFYKEQANLEYDMKAFMYGRVVNKKARFNICFADYDQEPDYENKKGRLVAFDKCPHLEKVRQKLGEIMPVKAEKLMAEGNYYYDISKCGIGYHGDTERRKVIGIRVGASLPLYYKWYKGGKQVAEKVKVELHNGDVYFMSQKTSGFDWKKKKIYTLRHATGSSKYIE